VQLPAIRSRLCGNSLADSAGSLTGVCCDHGAYRSHARDQALLLLASVEDYVAADNPVRFIDAFVDDLELCEAGFHRSRPKATGRPGYDPGRNFARDKLARYIAAAD